MVITNLNHFEIVEGSQIEGGVFAYSSTSAVGFGNVSTTTARASKLSFRSFTSERASTAGFSANIVGFTSSFSLAST